MLPFDFEPDLPNEGQPLPRIQRHGEDCLQGYDDGETVSHGSGWARAPSSRLGHGPRWEGELWGNAGKNQRIWGPSSPLTHPSRPPARGPASVVGDGGYHGDVGDDHGHVVCHHFDPLVVGVGSKDDEAGDLASDGCGFLLRMYFVQPRTCCKFSWSPVKQVVFLHIQMGWFAPLCGFFTGSDTLRLCAGVPNVHGRDELLEANLTPHLLHLHQNCEEVSSPAMIFCCRYANFILHHTYMEILDSVLRPIDRAARSLANLSCYQLSSVNSWSKISIIATILQYIIVHTQGSLINGSSIGLNGAMEESALNFHMASKQISGSAIDSFEQDHPKILSCTSCTCLSRLDDRLVEDAASTLFGLCHRRWTTTPPSLIPRFNSGDTLSLSSVKIIRYLQLNFIPRVHMLDRPLGEPPAGHQLDRTSIEALEDCRCGNFESGLSTDVRTPYGSICDLQHLHEFKSSSWCIVQLGTYLSCSTDESHVMMFHDP